MNKLPIKPSQLSFPNEKEIRITYEKSPFSKLNPVVNVMLVLTILMFFTSVLPQIILFSIFAILGIFKFKILDAALLEIILKPNHFEYLYHNTLNNREKYISAVSHIDFEIKIKSEVILVEFLDVQIELLNPNDLTLLVDKVAEMFDLEYYDTCRLSDNVEVLMYKKTSLNQLNYPSLINLEITTESLKIYDMLYQNSWFEINENTQQCTFIEQRFDDNILQMIDLNAIQKIQVLMRTRIGSQNRNKIIVSVVSVANERFTLLETQKRQSSQELITVRDMEKIDTELRKIKALDKVEIEKKIW